MIKSSSSKSDPLEGREAAQFLNNYFSIVLCPWDCISRYNLSIDVSIVKLLFVTYNLVNSLMVDCIKS